MYNIIPLIIILICLAIILAIILKKLPLLTSFDTSEIPAEKQSETKEKIMNERLKRKAKFFYGKVTPFGQLIVNFWQRKSEGPGGAV
jgi:biopolymer transport protein ExbD